MWCFLTRIASCHTIIENPNVTANNAEFIPCVIPTAVVSALVNAECALGIPPHLKKDFFVLEKIDLLAWAMNQAINALRIISFIPQVLLHHPQNSLASQSLILSLYRQ